MTHLPKVTLECQCLDARIMKPMYPRRLIITMCQLPAPPQHMFHACHFHMNVKVRQLYLYQLIWYCILPAKFNIQGVAIKKPDSCSKPLLKKIRQSKCYPLQCSPLPDPYTAPCEFSTVGSSAAGHLVLCCSRVVSLLLSLHPWTQTWFLWAQTWFSGKRKKSHGARSGDYGGCSITGMLFFAKHLFTDSALSWWRIREAFFHMSGLLHRTHSRRVVRTFL